MAEMPSVGGFASSDCADILNNVFTAPSRRPKAGDLKKSRSDRCEFDPSKKKNKNSVCRLRPQHDEHDLRKSHGHAKAGCVVQSQVYLYVNGFKNFQAESSSETGLVTYS
jgi:hypothetical protein